MSAHESCTGCRYYLGGGCCQLNLKNERAAGDYECWEAKEK